MKTARRTRGLTIVELAVALVVFSVVAVAATRVLVDALHLDGDLGTARSEELQIRLVRSQVERAARTLRAEELDRKAPFGQGVDPATGEIVYTMILQPSVETLTEARTEGRTVRAEVAEFRVRRQGPERVMVVHTVRDADVPAESTIPAAVLARDLEAFSLEPHYPESGEERPVLPDRIGVRMTFAGEPRPRPVGWEEAVLSAGRAKKE